MNQTDKVLENRCRRASRRRGWELSKSRVRDPKGLGYGSYVLTGACSEHSDCHLRFDSLDTLSNWIDQ